MAFTRFHDDPCRIQKYLEESTNVGNYHVNVPGQGVNLSFYNDPYLKIQKWGANLSKNHIDLENDLRGQTRLLNNDLLNNNEYNSYVEKNSLYNKNFYSTNNEEITHQSRVTHPAWKYREINYLNHKIEGDYCKGNFCEVPNNFNYLFMNPQENICIPFQNNVSSRILQKDYYNMNNNK